MQKIPQGLRTWHTEIVLLPTGGLGGSVQLAVTWRGHPVVCVTFFWRASEALLTQPTASDLSDGASGALNSCAAEQQPPLDLSVLARCLRRHAHLAGEVSRGIAAFDFSRVWASDPQGHLFRIPGRVPGQEPPVPGSRFVVFWLPAHGCVQWG